MTDWAAFTGFVGVVLVALLFLAHATQRAFDFDAEPRYPDSRPPDAAGERPEAPVGRLDHDIPSGPTLDDVPTATLLANVAVSQGVFLGIVVTAIWYTGVPLSSLGLVPDASVPGRSPPIPASSLDLVSAIALGIGFGVVLYALNEVGAALGKRIGLGSSEELREALAPESTGGWAVLLFVVLPIIAGFEELLFRGALIGALSVGAAQTGWGIDGVTPWLLVLGSSGAFALGHGAQGRGGVVVTGLLGLVLAGAFVLTWSLPLVFVAHYLVNALEFVVHEYVGVDWV